MEDNIEKTPLGWEVNLMFILLQCVDILVENIDSRLRARQDKFKREVKQNFKRYIECQKKASYWLHDVIGLDESFWAATDGNSKRYSNAIADAHELLRAMMLYVDRSHSEQNYYTIMRFLRSLPECGIFPSDYIEAFEFSRPWVYAEGDRVATERQGNGTLELNTVGDNWQIKLDSGDRIILHEKQFKLV